MQAPARSPRSRRPPHSGRGVCYCFARNSDIAGSQRRGLCRGLLGNGGCARHVSFRGMGTSRPQLGWRAAVVLTRRVRSCVTRRVTPTLRSGGTSMQAPAPSPRSRRPPHRRRGVCYCFARNSDRSGDEHGHSTVERNRGSRPLGPQAGSLCYRRGGGVGAGATGWKPVLPERGVRS